MAIHLKEKLNMTHSTEFVDYNNCRKSLSISFLGMYRGSTFFITFCSIYCIHYLLIAFVDSVRIVEDKYFWNSSDTRRYPWLKICNDHGQYEIQPGTWCSKGVHFPNGFTPECICPFGLWILKSKVCKMQTHFILGDGRHNICYKVDYKVESLIFLGDPDNVFASKAYVAPIQLNVFFEIPLNGSFTPLLDLEKPLIIHMFPINNRSIETEDGYCFPLNQPNPSNVPVHIWSSALGPSRFRIVDKCSDPLNFGFDDLIAPNMVFVRSNLIVSPNVPKPRQCNSSQIERCNKFTTTVRPPQYHTPRYQKVYYDMAKITPEDVEKAKLAESKQAFFHSVEVITPKEGNFTQFFTEDEKDVELPIMIGTKMYKELLDHSSRETEAIQGASRSSEKHDGKQVHSRSGHLESDELFKDIMEDVVKKDTFVRQNILQQLHKQNKNDLPDQQSNDNDEISMNEKTSGESSSVSESEEQLSQSTASSEGENAPVNRKRSIDFSHISGLPQYQLDDNVAWLNQLNEKARKQQRRNNDPTWGYSSVEKDPSGVCTGLTIPPSNCPKSTMSKVPFSNQPNGAATSSLMDIQRTDGSTFLKDLLQNFDNNIALDDDLRHVTSFAEKCAELFQKHCSIPDSIFPTTSLKIAIRTMLAQVSLKDLKSFSTRVFPSKELSLNKTKTILDNCSKETGTIRFLFKEKCPLKVSCTRYSISPEAAVKVITFSRSERPSSHHRSILSSTLTTLIRLLEIMCQNNWQANEGFHILKNALSKLGRLILKYHSSSSITPGLSNFTEQDVQSFLKVSNPPAYFMLLDKCISAGETISENRGIPSSLLLHYSAPTGEGFHKRNRKIREKRSSNTDTTEERVPAPQRIFDGAAICMNSYWDGVNKDNKDCNPIPTPILTD